MILYTKVSTMTALMMPTTATMR